MGLAWDSLSCVCAHIFFPWDSHGIWGYGDSYRIHVGLPMNGMCLKCLRETTFGLSWNLHEPSEGLLCSHGLHMGSPWDFHSPSMSL